MRRAIRIALFALIAAALSVSCQRRVDPIDELHDKGELRDLALNLAVDDMPEADVRQSGFSDNGFSALSYVQQIEQFASTKAGSTPGSVFENAIYDLNIFLVHTTLGDRDVRFFYFDALSNPVSGSPDPNKFPLILTNLFNGKYRVYAIANNGASLYTPSQGEIDERFNRCSLTEAQIKEIKTSNGQGYTLIGNSTNSSGLLMSSKLHCEPIDLTDRSKEFEYSLTLERRVAKIGFSYTIDLQAPFENDKFEPKTIKLNNVPWAIYPFSNTITPVFTNISQAVGTDENEFTLYALQNNQGEVPSIHNASERSAEIAPKNASYLFLDGKYTSSNHSKTTGYQIYLGDGRVTNFDMGGNKKHTIALNIEGNSANDKRVSTFQVSANKGIGQQDFYLTLDISYSNQYNNTFKLKYTDPSDEDAIQDLKVEMENPSELGTYIPLSLNKNIEIFDINKPTEDVSIKLHVTWKDGTAPGAKGVSFHISDKYFRTEKIDIDL